MGFFGFGGYGRPGRGLSKEEVEAEPRSRVFFAVIGRKLWHILSLNMLSFLCNLPLIFIIYVPLLSIGPENIFSKYFIAVAGLMLLGCGGTGILAPGFFYVLKTLSRQQHAWVRSEYFEYIKKNIKQSAAMTVIDIVAFALWNNAVMYYSGAEGVVPAVALSVLYIAAFVFYVMHGYVYLLMIEYDMKLKDILKNAFLFVLIKLPLNLASVAALLVISMLTFANSTEFGLIISFIIIPTLMGYINIFLIDPVVTRYMRTEKMPE